MNSDIDVIRLPMDCWLRVLSFCEVHNVLKVEMTCKYLKMIVATRSLWMYLFHHASYEQIPKLPPNKSIESLSDSELRQAVVHAARSLHNWNSRCPIASRRLRFNFPNPNPFNIPPEIGHPRLLVCSEHYLLIYEEMPMPRDDDMVGRVSCWSLYTDEPKLVMYHVCELPQEGPVTFVNWACEHRESTVSIAILQLTPPTIFLSHIKMDLSARTSHAINFNITRNAPFLEATRISIRNGIACISGKTFVATLNVPTLTSVTLYLNPEASVLATSFANNSSYLIVVHERDSQASLQKMVQISLVPLDDLFSNARTYSADPEAPILKATFTIDMFGRKSFRLPQRFADQKAHFASFNVHSTQGSYPCSCDEPGTTLDTLSIIFTCEDEKGRIYTLSSGRIFIRKTANNVVLKLDKTLPTRPMNIGDYVVALPTISRSGRFILSTHSTSSADNLLVSAFKLLRKRLGAHSTGDRDDLVKGNSGERHFNHCAMTLERLFYPKPIFAPGNRICTIPRRDNIWCSDSHVEHVGIHDGSNMVYYLQDNQAVVEFYD